MEYESPHINYNDNDTEELFELLESLKIKTLTANQKLSCFKDDKWEFAFTHFILHSEADMGTHITWRNILEVPAQNRPVSSFKFYHGVIL